MATRASASHKGDWSTEEPERYPTRFIVNDGQWTSEEHERSSIRQLKLATTSNGIEKLVKKPKGNSKSSSAAWQNGSEKSKVEASKTTQQFLMVHLLRKLHPCELFQKFTMLSVRMILPRLQRRSRSSRKPLQQQAEAVQQLSTQEMNLQGLVPHQCSLHHHQSQ